MNPPCFNCERRHVGCHKKCVQYAVYKQKLSEIKTAREADNKNEKSLIEYEQARYHRTM